MNELNPAPCETVMMEILTEEEFIKIAFFHVFVTRENELDQLQ